MNVNVKYNGKCLEWENIWKDLHMIRSEDSRRTKYGCHKWYPSQHSPICLFEFLEGYGYGNMNGANYTMKGFSSSNISVLLLNKYFARYLTEHEPELAIEIGIADLAGTYREGKSL